MSKHAYKCHNQVRIGSGVELPNFVEVPRSLYNLHSYLCLLMTAEIMKLDFNPHLKNILVQIGHGNFKGKSKAKAADKILAFVRGECECGILL